MKLYNGYERLPRDYSILCDEYEYTMNEGYIDTGENEKEVVFDLFFRKVPNGGGYAIMAGLDKVIAYINQLNFKDKNIDYFIRTNHDLDLIEELRNFKFTGDIYAIPDGTPVFPNEPLITVKAPLSQADILETMLLSCINGAMEHATGARAVVEAARKNGCEVVANKKVPIMEFGARRADGPEAAIDASLYGIMAGCVGTSNCLAADMINQKALGTMAHHFIETYKDELTSFRAFAKKHPDNCILLVDTIDTLRSGVPNAIKVFKEMQEQNIPTNHIGVRIDSGNLPYLSKEVRKMLNEAGFPQAKICLSNGLSPKGIEGLLKENAQFESLGVGDNISKPDGRMGCVYKEVALKEKNKWVPKMKLSEDTIKILNPGFKKLYRVFANETGFALADVMCDINEELPKDNLKIVNVTDPTQFTILNNYTLKELQVPIFQNGKQVYEDLDIIEQAKFCDEEMSKIYPETKRLEEPHPHHVSGTEEYVEKKYQLIKKLRNNIYR